MIQIKYEIDKTAKERQRRQNNIEPVYCEMQLRIELFRLDLSNYN